MDTEAQLQQPASEPPPLHLELYQAVQNSANRKFVGPYEVPMEPLKMLLTGFTDMHGLQETGKRPQHWIESIYIYIYLL